MTKGTESEHTFRAENGLLIRLRPMRPSDVPHLLDIFHHLSVESRYLRFNLPLADPDPAWLQKEAERMADVPPDQGGAWLAFVDLPEEGQTCIGGVRYIYVGNKKAEVALTVRDDLQGLGIGTAMLGFIGRRAYLAGARKLVGVVQAQNSALWRALQRLNVPVKRRSQGSQTEVEVTLDPKFLFKDEDGGEYTAAPRA